MYHYWLHSVGMSPHSPLFMEYDNGTCTHCHADHVPVSTLVSCSLSTIPKCAIVKEMYFSRSFFTCFQQITSRAYTCISPLQAALLCGFNYTKPNKATAGGHPVDYLNPHSEVQCTYMYILLCAMVSLHVYCMAVVYICTCVL